MGVTVWWTSVVNVVLVVKLAHLAAALGLEERGVYCQSETFRAKCWANEVIVMLEAQYGRMRLGRCVVADLGYIGCRTDVLRLSDRWCSGRRTCEIGVPNGELDETEPCYQELKTYLEAAYTCVKVAIAEKSFCSSVTHVKLQAPEGHISSEITDETGCGSPKVPWVMDVTSGQIVNISLLSFGFKELDTYKSRPFGHGACHQIGHIVERNPKRNHTICAEQEREVHLFTSKSNKVEITILDSAARQGFIFMLRYEIVGCSDLRPPHSAWYEREGDHAIIRCKTMEKSWHLRCIGNSWKGVVGNCTAPRVAPSADAVLSPSFVLSKELSIVIVLSLALGVALMILAVGFACLVRRRRSGIEKTPVEGRMSSSTLSPDGTKPFYHVIRGDTDSALMPYPLHSDKSISDGGNEYAHTTQNASTLSDSDYGSQSCSSSFAATRQGGGGGGGLKGAYQDGSYDLDRSRGMGMGMGPASAGSSTTYAGPRYFVLDRDVKSQDANSSSCRQDPV